MGSDTSPAGDPAEQLQRDAERTALRKVRGTLDGLAAADQRRRRALRKVLLFCALLLFAGLGLVLMLVGNGRERGAPVELPSTIPLRK
jgi:hypothetical protein